MIDIELADHITWKNLEAGIVLLDLNTSNYYTLNETSSFICQKIIDGCDESEILDEMLKIYDCEKEVCQADIKEQIHFLEKNNFLKK